MRISNIVSDAEADNVIGEDTQGLESNFMESYKAAL